MTTIPQEREDILTKRAFGHVATIGPDGEPQSNPVWIDWDGEYLKFSQTTTRQKVQNVRRDARISVSVHDPEEPYRYLEIRGRVERIESDEDKSFIDKLAKKYLDKDHYPWSPPDEERLILYVRPEHTTAQ